MGTNKLFDSGNVRFGFREDETLYRSSKRVFLVDLLIEDRIFRTKVTNVNHLETPRIIWGL